MYARSRFRNDNVAGFHVHLARASTVRIILFLFFSFDNSVSVSRPRSHTAATEIVIRSSGSSSSSRSSGSTRGDGDQVVGEPRRTLLLSARVSHEKVHTARYRFYTVGHARVEFQQGVVFSSFFCFLSISFHHFRRLHRSRAALIDQKN